MNFLKPNFSFFCLEKFLSRSLHQFSFFFFCAKSKRERTVPGQFCSQQLNCNLKKYFKSIAVSDNCVHNNLYPEPDPVLFSGPETEPDAVGSNKQFFLQDG